MRIVRQSPALVLFSLIWLGALPRQNAANALPAAIQATQNGAPPAADTTGQEIDTLRSIEEDYLRAEMEDNESLAESILADDYIGVRGDGGTAAKSEVLRNLARHERSRAPYTIVATNMREHIFWDTACVTYTKIYTRPPSPAAYSENVMHIFTKRNGQWHLQVSSLMPAPRP